MGDSIMPSRLRLAQSPAARRKPLGIRCGTQRSGGRCSPREPRELVRRDFIFFSKLPCIVMHLAALFSRFRAYVRQSRRVAGIPGKGMVSLSHAAAFSPKFLNSELTTHESGFLLSAFCFPFPPIPTLSPLAETMANSENVENVFSRHCAAGFLPQGARSQDARN